MLKEEHFEAMHSERVQELENQLKEKDVILQEYRKEHGRLDVFFDRIIRNITPIVELPNVYSGEYNKSTVDSPVEMVMQNTDWHTGEVQEPLEIEYFNAYNPTIQEKRIIEMDRISLRWLDTHRKDYRIDKLRVIFTGDMLSGDIHQELSVTNAYPVPVQVCESAKYIALSVAAKAPYFAEVEVDYIVPDNHSRLMKKPQAKEAGMNSLNYIVAVLAKAYLEKFKNITFNIHVETEKVINVNGMRYLVAHGNNIVGWMGVPWYSIERMVGREAKARMQIIMTDIEKAKAIGFNKFIFGHWHTNFDSDLYACASSLSGTSAYDHQQGRFSRPGQPVWLVHPRIGELDRNNIRLHHIV